MNLQCSCYIHNSVWAYISSTSY